MFGMGIGKHKRKLEQALADSLEPLKDELGNVPIPMQTDPAINGLILGICDTYAASKNITKPDQLAVLADAVFEDLYRIESINVQDRVDSWKDEKNDAFQNGYQQAQKQASSELELNWFTAYAEANFEPATGKML